VVGTLNELDRFRGSLLGLACGDAVGTTVEFKPRGNFLPITDMTGKGPFDLKPGEWTDDTSMALCLATSLVESKGFDPLDQMERYCRWRDTGYLSSNGVCFDIGMTTSQALYRYRESGDPFSGPTDPHTAGNGSLMRLAPVILFYFPDRERILHYSAESSRTTHGAPECLEACQLFAEKLYRALCGADKQEILTSPSLEIKLSEPLRAIARGTYFDKSKDDIHGTGYVVASMEAALWSFWMTDTFEEAILMAANLGEDADTTAAICGQLAGAYYGESGIPQHWLDRLVMKEELGGLAVRLRSVDSST